MKTIRTDRLTLRDPEESDLPAITEMIGDIAVSSMLTRVPHPYTMEDATAWFRQINTPGSEHWQIFSIIMDERIVGMVGFRRKAGNPSLGYWLGKSYWGRGIMSEASKAAVGWFFDNHDVDVLLSGAFADNIGSLRIQEKLGFDVASEGMETCLATGERRREFNTRLHRDVFRARH